MMTKLTARHFSSADVAGDARDRRAEDRGSAARPALAE